MYVCVGYKKGSLISLIDEKGNILSPPITLKYKIENAPIVFNGCIYYLTGNYFTEQGNIYLNTLVKYNVLTNDYAIIKLPINFNASLIVNYNEFIIVGQQNNGNLIIYSFDGNDQIKIKNRYKNTANLNMLEYVEFHKLGVLIVTNEDTGERFIITFDKNKHTQRFEIDSRNSQPFCFNKYRKGITGYFFNNAGFYKVIDIGIE